MKQDVTLERVIFRKESDTFGSNGTCILACYPDDNALIGNISATPMRITPFGMVFFEPYTEVSDDYYYHKTKSIRDKQLTEQYRMELERYFNGNIQFAVCLKR